MSHSLNDIANAGTNGMSHLKEMASDELDSMKEGVEAAGEKTAHALQGATGTFSNLIKGVTATLGAVSLAGQVTRGLARIGLMRRPSPLRAVALFGAGVAVGAGLGVLFAPASGSDTRRSLEKGIKGLFGSEKPAVKAATNGAAATVLPSP